TQIAEGAELQREAEPVRAAPLSSHPDQVAIRQGEIGGEVLGGDVRGEAPEAVSLRVGEEAARHAARPPSPPPSRWGFGFLCSARQRYSVPRPPRGVRQMSSIVFDLSRCRMIAGARFLAPSLGRRPPLWPRARAASSPARVRSRMRSRSNSA